MKNNRNEYQEYFPGGKKRPVRKADNLPLSCAVVTKSGNLNFLELSGPLQTCNGTDFILYYNIMLWDRRHICGPSLIETSLRGAYLY